VRIQGVDHDKICLVLHLSVGVRDLEYMIQVRLEMPALSQMMAAI
jgi:hypothetical protein